MNKKKLILIADDEIGADAEVNHIDEQKADHAHHQPKALYIEQVVQLGIALQHANAHSLMQDGENGAERDQQPDYSAGVVAHEIQQRICCYGDGDGQVAPLIDRGNKQKCADQRGDEKSEKVFFLQVL